MAGDKALPAEIVEQILARTDGVPLFVEELTKAVLESGLLRTPVTTTSFRPAAAARDPDDAAGLADGPPRPSGPVKEIAQIGAVIGREFSHELLAAVSPMSERAEGRAGAAGGSELVFRRGRRPRPPTPSSTRWSRTPPTSRS